MSRAARGTGWLLRWIAGAPGIKDAALFYFMDAKVAAEFVEAFGCELVTGHERPASRDPQWSRR